MTSETCFLVGHISVLSNWRTVTLRMSARVDIFSLKEFKAAFDSAFYLNE